MLLSLKRYLSDCASRLLADEKAIELALEKAGENRGEITAALAQATEKQRPGMEFLVIHMPEEDLKTLTAEFLLSIGVSPMRLGKSHHGGNRSPKNSSSITFFLMRMSMSNEMLGEPIFMKDVS